MRKSEQSKIVIKRDRALINSHLKKILGKIKGPRVLCRAMEYAVFPGGKRLRPILTMEACRALKGDMKKALPFACAVELVHSFSLVHDDLPSMDNDDFRRGKPSCHKRFGEGPAILAGDGLLNLAFEILAGSKQKNTPEIIFLLSDAIGTRNMMGGQALDLQYKKTAKKSSTLKYKINSMKTAALMAVSCKIGAIIAEAKARDVNRMHEFGINLGHAFQIADDIKDSPQSSPSSNRMKEEAKLFISKGQKQIAPFKKKANTLKHIADGVVKWKSF